jgi:outer membrane protein OmpA-like peptidoglycan-associated protein
MRRVFLVALLALLSGCAAPSALRGKIQGLSEITDEAERNGARRCAPRELALAQSHLRFAMNKLDQGELVAANEHVLIAEPNARAARDLSPADRCTDHPVVVKKPGDKDGDGILDTADKCPNDPETYNGFEDTDGCPDTVDTDSDGIADTVDQCVLEPEDKDGYLDEDGCPDKDNDADGIADDADKCPDKPEDLDGFQDEDGCPDTDNDGDTVADVEDMCPNTPGSPSAPKKGCPGLVVVTGKEIRITQQIQFEFNKAVIRPGISFKILDEVVQVLKDNPKIKIEVQGHTDNVGQAAYNLKLSQQRADAVRAYLVGHGIDPSRLVSKGYGMTQPLVPNTSEGNRALNRRVQFIRTEGSAGTSP